MKDHYNDMPKDYCVAIVMLFLLSAGQSFSFSFLSKAPLVIIASGIVGIIATIIVNKAFIKKKIDPFAQAIVGIIVFSGFIAGGLISLIFS